MPVYFFNSVEYEVLKELYPEYYLEVLVKIKEEEEAKSKPDQ